MRLEKMKVAMQANNTPDELSDEALLAYLDGEAQTEIVNQIENSPRYLNRLKELTKIQNHLLEGLYRQLCPDSTELGEYHLNLLSMKKARAIKNHVNDCPHCAKELLDLRRFLKQETAAIETGITDHVKILVAQLVSGLQKGMVAPAPAYALRGAEKGILVYEVEGIRVNLDLQETAGLTKHRNILGLITGLQAQGYLVDLIHGDKTISRSQVDENGNFMFSEIPIGEYQFVISGTEVEIRMDVKVH
jgi:hypothetical protein